MSASTIIPILFATLFAVAVVVFFIATMWKVFSKAGQPGWGCLIPIYNIYCLVKIAGKPGWWTILMFVPLINIVISILVVIGIATNFGKSGLFAVGLIFVPFICYPILAFGDAQYGEERGEMEPKFAPIN